MPGIRFKEDMDGYVGENIKDFRDGEDYGKRYKNTVKIEGEIEVDSVDEFIQVSSHEAEFRGKFYCESLGGKASMVIENGRFNLFSIDSDTGHRNMKYSFNFNTPGGKQYYFYGCKDIFNDKVCDLIEDMTTLFTRIYEGKDSSGKLYGSGIMYFRIKDITSIVNMIKSSEVIGTDDLLEKINTIGKFLGFFIGETWKTYAPGPRFFYKTNYENLVLSGKLRENGENKTREFFFFSGEHNKGFPWGDEETMSDVALLISDGNGDYIRFGITKRSLQGFLNVDLKGNKYTYIGELYQINEGHSLSFSEINSYKAGGNIEKVTAEINLELDAQAQERVDVTFKLIEDFEKIIPDKFKDMVTEILLGYFAEPYKVKVTKGSIKITSSTGETVYSTDQKGTFGEGELGKINNLKEPTMWYNYLCGIDPKAQTLYLKMDYGTLRDEREWYIKDLFDKKLGEIFKRDIKKNLILKKTFEKNPSVPAVVKDNLLTLVNDHYPTAVFLRRIVEIKNNGKTFYGLEEHIDAINMAPINSDKETTVAVFTYKDADKRYVKPPKIGDEKGRKVYEKKVLNIYNDKEKFDVLDKVIAGSAFFEVLEKALAKSNKGKEDFSIIIKPNFMFVYSTSDKTTYTDPTLVEHLVQRIYEKGYRNIKIAEARSTLSVFFEGRDVKNVASYVGFKEGGKYQIIDLSEDLEDYDYGGKLGKHFVNKDWKSADFRVSFAKNKTHSYALYTLAIKNIYGALPMEFKFKAYHCDIGDIYKSTMDYIKHFPIHFGFVDGVTGADGPFGIFADPYPQLTMTIIGGEDIVAVDWVGASKMGIEPMISVYMQEAVKIFGKPRIRLTGNGELYKFWANTPRIASWASHNILDYYTFGYPVYYLLSESDPRFPAKPATSEILTMFRPKLKFMREIFFKEPGQLPSVFHQALNKLFLLWQ